MLEIEKKVETYTGVYIARLGDLGLGKEGGIPSAYEFASEEELSELAEVMTERLKDPTDLTACACIDGRHTKHNADGSPAELRLRRVGGSGSNLGVALNAGAPIVNELASASTLGNKIHTIDAYLEAKTGFGRSAHLGNCGGVNGEIADNIAIAENPAVMLAVKAIMEIPQVRAELGVDFDAELAELVQQNAAMTAQILEEAGWHGQTYVDGVKDEKPSAVEDLEVDHDHEHHGHRENTLTIIVGDKTLEGADDFVWNIAASKKIAEALAGDRGTEGYVQALIAEIAKHAAVAARLPSKETPVMLLTEN